MSERAWPKFFLFAEINYKKKIVCDNLLTEFYSSKKHLVLWYRFIITLYIPCL